MHQQFFLSLMWLTVICFKNIGFRLFMLLDIIWSYFILLPLFHSMQVYAGSVCSTRSSSVPRVPLPTWKSSLAHPEGTYPEGPASAQPDPRKPEHRRGVWEHQEQHWGRGEGLRRRWEISLSHSHIYTPINTLSQSHSHTCRNIQNPSHQISHLYVILRQLRNSVFLSISFP